MGRTCMVCSSPNREIYENLKFKENKSIKEIWTLANEKYHENIGYYSFQRHFQEMREQMDSLKKSSKLRQQIVEEEIKKDIEIAQRLRRNLEICAENIEKYAQKDILTHDEEKSLLEFIAKSTLIIEELLKWSKQLNVRPNTSDIFDRILFCMKDFPLEYIKKFQMRWNEYESGK